MTRGYALPGALIMATAMAVAAVPLATSDGVDQYFGERDGLACAGCHGLAGEGGGEGGISIPAIADRVGPGRAYPTAQSLCTLLATGRRARLPNLSNLMPRYMMSATECSALFRYTASLAQPLFAPSDARLRVSLTIDPRSIGQAGWQATVKDQLERANAAGGIYGRTFVVEAAGSDELVRLNLSGSRDTASNDVPSILLQAQANRPMTKAIESGSLDEIRAVAAAYPGETVVIVDPLGKSPDITKLATAAEAHKTRVISVAACHSDQAQVTRAIILSMTAAADFGLASLSSCKGLQSAAISLRTVKAGDIAAAARLGLLPPVVSVFTPVPTGAQFAEIPEVIAQIIVDMTRRMGGNPTRAGRIQSFEQAWRTHARGDNALFSGATIADVDPLTMTTRSEPAWHDAP